MLLDWMCIFVFAGSVRVGWGFTRPQCEPSEPCLFEVSGIPIQFCHCPGKQECAKTSKNTLQFQNVNYQFCSDASFKPCAEGDVAWVRKGLRQFVNCVCPEPLRLQSQQWNDKDDVTEYTCSRKNICAADSRCMVREHVTRSDGKKVSALREVCECPASTLCREEMESIEEDGREKDVFSCQA